MTAAAPSEFTFVVDSMLGKVAKWLRLLGYDTVSARISDPAQIAFWAGQGRILLSRNRKWRGLPHLYLVDADRLDQQLRQVIAELGLEFDRERALTRCARCNRVLEPIARAAVEGWVPDAVLAGGWRFHRCPQCARIYWPGSHSERILDRLQRFWNAPGRATD